MGERITFAVSAAVAIGSALGVVLLRNPFRAAVSLIGTLMAVAVMFLLLAAPFVAAIQVIVYAGAIVVLFLFVIAYLGDRPALLGRDPLERYEVVWWLAIITLGVQGFVALANTQLPGMFDSQPQVGDIGSPRAVGLAFTDRFLLPFEATSLVLLVAALGAVLLARRAVMGEGAVVEVPLGWFLLVSGALFLLGLFGVLRRRNPLLLLLSVELMLNSANVALVGFSRYWGVTDGQVFALVVMVVAAAEVVIGLGLVVAVFRQRMHFDVDGMSRLRG